MPDPMHADARFARDVRRQTVRSSALAMSEPAQGLVLPRPWYRTLDRAQWSALAAANLGWLFDGYETYALILGVGGALRQLLDPARAARAPSYVGLVVALTLLGWGVGGLVGGL